MPRPLLLHPRLLIIVVVVAVLFGCGWVDDGVDANQPPQAVSADYAVTEGGLLEVTAENGVLANDHDPGGRPLTARLVEPPQHATTFSLHSDGSFVYQHDGSDALLDSFTYAASDGVDESPAVRVSIVISGVNDPPRILTAPARTIAEDSVLELTLDDFEVEDDSEALQLGLLEGENYSISGQSITPVNNFHGELTVGAFVDDGEFRSKTVYFSVRVTPVNDAPLLRQPAPDTVWADERSEYALSLAGYFEDADGDALRYGVKNLPPGLALDPLSGWLTGRLAEVDGGTSDYQMVVSATDPAGARAEWPLTFRVADVNRAPVAKTLPDQTVKEGQTVRIALSQYFTDPDGDALRFSATGLAAGLNLLVTEGEIVGTPTQADAGKVYSVVVTVDDGRGGSASSSFRMEIRDVNQAPQILTPIGTRNVTEGREFVIDVSGGFTDPDHDTLRFTASPLPPTFSFDGATGILKGTPSDADARSAPLFIRITAVDPGGLTTDDDLTLSIANVNQPPTVIGPIDDQLATSGVRFNFDATPHFRDPDGDTLTYSASGLPASLVMAPAGQITGTPTASDTPHSPYTVHLEARDGDNGVGATDFLLHVAANAPPNALADCLYTRQEQPLVARLHATDANDIKGLTFRILSAPTKGDVLLTDPGTGEFRYTPHAVGSRGKDSFRFEVRDPSGEAASAQETVIVAPKIMPLGDSITTGYMRTVDVPPEQRIGYRKRLYERLENNGFHIDFVGSQRYGELVMADPDNEGWGGMTDNWFASRIYDWLDQNPADVVLVHVGSNGLDPSPSDVERLLSEIDRWENDSARGNSVWVLLARIIDQNPSHPDVQRFNDAVQRMAETRIGGGDQIEIIDQQRALWDANSNPDPLLYDDYLHPNQAGYERMADTWFEALRKRLDTCSPGL